MLVDVKKFLIPSRYFQIFQVLNYDTNSTLHVVKIRDRLYLCLALKMDPQQIATVMISRDTFVTEGGPG